MAGAMAQLKKKLHEAEKEARNLSAGLIAESSNYDTQSVEALLNVSRTLNGLMKELSALPARDASKKAMNDVQIASRAKTNPALLRHASDTSSSEPKEFPVFFVLNGLLYKVGEKERRSPNDEHPGFWWKTIDLNEALSIMDSINAFRGQFFRQSDILSEFGHPIPSYRVDIVVSSLKSLGYIETVKRGVYRVKNGNPNEWVDALQGLPERGDLLMRAKK